MRHFVYLATICSVITGASRVAAITATWESPQLDRWLHQGEASPGYKDSLSTFTSFEPGGTASGGPLQARSGTFALAFNTGLKNIPLVAPERYQIDSIRVTLQMVDSGAAVVYDPTRDYVSQIAAGTDDPGKPVELFGVGFANGYTRFGWGPNNAQPPEFEEASPATSNGAFAYNVYPLGERPDGMLGNVFNSPGGEGVFDSEGELIELTTPAWDPTPWAIGTLEGVSAGEVIAGEPIFNFNVDLDLPGVREYFQQSLAIGQVSVMIASMHDLSGFHSSAGVEEFPAFYSKDHIAVYLFGVASAAGLTLEYSILPLTGDYDGNGYVDQLDYVAWKLAFGSLVSPFTGADGNGDGSVDLADYTLWRDNLGSGTPPGSGNLLAFTQVPEPGSQRLLATLAITMVFFGWVNWFVSQHREAGDGE